jgi:acyl carrier protein
MVTEIAEQVRGIWQERLALPTIADTDDFFLLGGHSLIMQKIQLDIKETLGIEVPMDELFRRATIGQISEHLDSLLPADRAVGRAADRAAAYR